MGGVDSSKSSVGNSVTNSSIGGSNSGIGVSSIGTSIGTSNRESSIAIGGIVGFSLGLGLSLGHMDNSSRVGNIPASTSIASSNSGNSSRGQTIDAHRGRGAQTGITSSKAKAIGISSVGTISTSTINTGTINTGTIDTSNWKTSIAICCIVWISFGLSHGTSGQTYDSQELVHLDFV